MPRGAAIPALVAAFVLVGCGGDGPSRSAIEAPGVASTVPPSATTAPATAPVRTSPTTTSEVTSVPTSSVAGAPAPPDSTADLVEWTAWTSSNWVNDLAVDDDVVWAATEGGLVRWDRRTGSAVTLSPLPGDPDVRIRSVDVASRGEVWVGLCGRLPTVESEPCGVARLDPAGWTIWRGAAGLVGEQSFEIATGPDGTVWAGGLGGLSVFDGAGWAPVAVDLPSNDVQSLAVAPDGTVWAGTWNGLVSISVDGAARTWTNHSAPSIAITDDGVVWFGEWDMGRQAGGVRRITPGGEVELVGLEDHHIWSLAAAGDAVYAATSVIPSAFWRDPVDMTGPLLWRAELTGLEAVPGAWDEISTHQLLAVAAERGGHVWIGGLHGVWSLDGSRYLTDGPGPWPATVDATDDVVWTNGWLNASWFDGTSWSSVVGDAAPAVDLLAAPDGTVWAGTAGGLVRISDGVATAVPTDPAGRPWSSYLPDLGGEGDEQLGWDLEVGPDGTVWATAGSGGLWDLTRGDLSTEADGLPSDDLDDVAVDGDGLVCVSDGRVACRTNGGWSILDDIPGAERVWRIVSGEPGSLWALAATSEPCALLARWSAGTWDTFSNLDTTIAPGFTSDDSGAVWYGIHRGAVRFDGRTMTERRLPWLSSEQRDDWDVVRVVEIAPDGTLWMIDGEVLYRSAGVTVAEARYGDWPLRSKLTTGRGDQGDAVVYLQRVLHDRADALGVNADGIFGPMTEQAVRRLQLAARLDVDGIVGPQTWQLVDALATVP